MATDAERAAEAGVSLIEALLMLAVLAIVASLTLDFAQGGAVRALHQASRSADHATEALAELRFRQIISNASGDLIRAQRDLVVIDSVAAAPGYCSAWPARQPIALELVRSGDGARLQCRTARGVEALAQWDGAVARFSYSEDGVSWSDVWRPELTAPYVRLQVHGPEHVALWLARPSRAPASETGS